MAQSGKDNRSTMSFVAWLGVAGVVVAVAVAVSISLRPSEHEATQEPPATTPRRVSEHSDSMAHVFQDQSDQANRRGSSNTDEVGLPIPPDGRHARSAPAPVLPTVVTQRPPPAQPDSLATAEQREYPGDLLARLRTTLEAECALVEEALAEDLGKRPREELLVMFGRSSAASGQFTRSAAACAMFLGEFGVYHELAERIAVRLADSLAPLDLNHATTIHTADGPRFEPVWRLRKTASRDQLHLAIDAYELAARLASEPKANGEALLKLGWVHRALQDWHTSAETWKRCASAAPGTRPAADALWLAAENLAWTGQPGEGAELLDTLIQTYPRDRRRETATRMAREFRSEAARSDAWFDDPVASLSAEIEARESETAPEEVYRSVVSWLARSHETDALISVCRWAVKQTGWPTEAQTESRYRLVDALLGQAISTDEGKREAAEVLGEIVSFAATEERAVPACLRRVRLLSELSEFASADQALAQLESRYTMSPRWQLKLLLERIRMSLDRDDLKQAKILLGQFVESYPDLKMPDDLVQRLADSNSGEGE